MTKKKNQTNPYFNSTYTGAQDEISYKREIRKRLIEGNIEPMNAKVLLDTYNEEKKNRQREVRLQLDRYKILHELGQTDLLVREITEEREVKQLGTAK
jgi:hypothetical protein